MITKRRHFGSEASLIHMIDQRSYQCKSSRADFADDASSTNELQEVMRFSNSFNVEAFLRPCPCATEKHRPEELLVLPTMIG